MYNQGVLVAAAIAALLQRSGNLQANNGAIVLQPPAADGVASGALPSPVLELSCDREPLLSVSVQLRTGRLLLHSGNGGSGGFFGNLGQELAPLLRQVCLTCLPYSFHHLYPRIPHIPCTDRQWGREATLTAYSRGVMA